MNAIMEKPVPTTTAATTPLVMMRDVSVKFVTRDRTVHAVNGVDIDLAAGEVLCILGESGSGKSVTMRALMRLLPTFAQVSGRIEVAGRDVVVVSASGEEIVAPIARALGATHAMATRMVVEDGKYTGEVGFYCYGEGKVQAIRELAAREGYLLDHCYAYSDSITDLPMLDAVGHPTVVNPDRALRKEATERGWAIVTFTRPISLRDRIPAPSGAAVATTAAVGVSALAAGAITYSLLRRFVL